MKEIVSEKAVVRIHEGNLTAEKRKKVLEVECRRIWQSVQASARGSEADAVTSA